MGASAGSRNEERRSSHDVRLDAAFDAPAPFHTLGLLIPPSLTLIVYGVTIDESITKLFIAGILPRPTLALLFMGYVAAWYFVRRDQRPDAPAVDAGGHGVPSRNALQFNSGMRSRL